MSIIKNILTSHILPFLIPTYCPCCERPLLDETKAVCDSCYQELEATATCTQRQKTCKVCSLSLHSQAKKGCWKDLNVCQGRRIFFDRHISLYLLSKKWNKLLQDWKFHGNRFRHRVFLGKLMQQTKLFKRYGIERIGYIASSASNRDTRSYQPCQDLAAFLARLWQIDFGADVYKCKRHKQSGKSYPERFFAIHQALAIAKDFPQPPPKHYLLLEDVFTTGATANEAARVLKKKGVTKVFLLSMLKVLRA